MNLLKKTRKKHSDDSLWSSVSDLMSGLMIVFLFISISFMAKIDKENVVVKEEQKAIKGIVDTYEGIRFSIYEDLSKEFKSDMERWKIEIDPIDLSVKFKEPEVFFETGRAELKTEFEYILSDFFPRYINIIYGKYKDNIEEIKIEGYTSSEWGPNVTMLESYFNNMELSQSRTRNVLSYVMNLESVKPHHEWLIEHITANGMSYSHRKYIDEEKTQEDKAKSRRVEFKVKTNAEQIISEIIKEYSGNK